MYLYFTPYTNIIMANENAKTVAVPKSGCNSISPIGNNPEIAMKINLFNENSSLSNSNCDGRNII